MIRRSKRQQKDTAIEQEPSAALDCHVELDDHKDDAGTSPIRDINRQTKKDKTKRELDSVVQNLQEELQKAASIVSSRPKRERKITEKAKLEMKAKQSKAKNALKKIENEKESSEELKEKVKGERGFSKSKSKEPEHKNKHEGKDNQTKAHTKTKDIQNKKNGELLEKQNCQENGDSDSQNSDSEDQIEIEDQGKEELKGKSENQSGLRQQTDMSQPGSKIEENKEIYQKNQESQQQQQSQNVSENNKKNSDKIQLFQEQEGDDDNLSSNSIRSKARKMPWSEEEDRLVIKLVEQHGPQKWTYIAQHIPGRIGKQCRERWHNHLNPRISKLAWCEDEEWLLFLCHRLKGNKWADITQYLIGRTDNAIKNHWNSSMKKRLPELIHRYAGIRRQEKVHYELAEEYKAIEQELLTSLMQLPQHPDDQDSLMLLKQLSNNSINPKNSDAQNNTPRKQSKNMIKKQNKINNLKNASQGNNDQDSLKHIIESIPQEGEAFKSFRKQLLLCQDEFYSQHTPSAKITEDSQLVGFSSQNTAFDTPQAVRQMVEKNPAFADLVKTYLKYNSDAKNISSNKNMSSHRNSASVDRIQLSATSTLLSAAPRGMEDEDDQDQGQQENKDGDNDNENGSNLDKEGTKDDGNSTKDLNKKKRGRKPKEIPAQSSKQGLKKKIGAAPPGFIHPMYLMNIPHGQPHPFYHPHHGYLPPPPPHIMAQHMKGYSHQFPHGIPPPPHHFVRNGQMPYPHQIPIRANGQGNGVIPPLQRLIHPISSSGAARHIPPAHYAQDDEGSNNNSQDSCSQEELQDIEANSSFYTPQKYQKNNLGERSAFKPLTPQTDGASCGINQSNKLDNQPATSSTQNDKELLVKDSAFREQYIDEFARLQGSSFSKENINPNTLLHNSKQLLNQITGTTGLAPTAHAASTSRFATPNKYETPSKLLDFGSEPKVNCSSVDNYFRYSSNHKSHHHHAGTLYASHANNFNRSSNSAFKCYPQLDFQEGGSSAKKQAFS